MNLFDPLSLPNGSIIPNRLAKAAMEENLADAEHAPSAALLRLYQAWAAGGTGLLISGNVMIDGRAMTGPGGVVLEDARQLQRFRDWARTGQARGAQFWLQLNHPGRQMPANLGQPTWAPSAVPLALGNLSRHFALPRAMDEDMIAEVIERFANSARLAEQAGFDGVQIHAAHGYLLSQFLSPLSNQRNDRWGGSLDNRARLLLEVVKAVRAVVSPRFAVAVKLNSADFQRGGFSAEDARAVLQRLNGLAVDLVELSGGSYEAPAMQGDARDGRTLAREAYFIEFARDLKEVATMPLMVTGGIRRKPVAEQVIDSGVAMAGIGTALALEPELPRHWREGRDSAPVLRPITWKNKVLASLGNMAAVKFQLRRLGRGKPPRPQVAPSWALLVQQLGNARQARRYRRWITLRRE
ncbi:NADH:flavin oxidoreductase/NADH oxidase family protein [Pseudomonas japonica]|uniref:NADH:flavin oxidoreductase/NADH oxidase family protein n=1 Tax=Pseudomonas japonica TaxID=256466 RepID=UPI0037F3324B